MQPTFRQTALRLLAAFGAALALGTAAHADGQVGTTLPGDFPVIVDASLGRPVIGFGAAGEVKRTPVVFLHGNNDTPFAAGTCSVYGRMQAVAQHFADHARSTSSRTAWAWWSRASGCAPTRTRTTRCVAWWRSTGPTTASSTARPRR
jgi:hypothetical protein